jgi:DNA (cytosine-5)-methyltransferase 1
VWWNLPAPPRRKKTFSNIVVDNPDGVVWHTEAETRRLLSLMSPLNRQKVEQAKKMGKRMVGGVYKRTRVDQWGNRVQRAEIRFDDIAGCLRTPVGGSSRQSIMIVQKDNVKSRLLAPREAARLMGLPDSYKLPTNYNEAYHLAGDGVVVPVVRFLSEHILEPLLEAASGHEKEAA